MDVGKNYSYPDIRIYPTLTDIVKKIHGKFENQRIKDKEMLAKFLGHTGVTGAFNARIVVTKGLFTYLEPKEIKTVLAHELGHVVHRDFIVMAIASVIIQLFYEIYRISLRVGQRGKKKSGTLFLLAGAIGYVFYIIGIYIVLFLNRIRERDDVKVIYITQQNRDDIAECIFKTIRNKS